MTTSGQRNSKLSDEDVEPILRDFYRREMPAELRRDEFAQVAPSAVSSRDGSRAALIAVAACALLLAVTVLGPGGGTSIRDHRKPAVMKSNSIAKKSAAKSSTVVAVKKPGVSPFPRKYVPIELRWIRELKPVYEQMQGTFFGDYLSDQFDFDDWERQFGTKLFFPDEEDAAQPTRSKSRHP